MVSSAVQIPDRLSLIAPEDLRLRRQSRAVARVDGEIRRLAAMMLELMRREQGIGLAAPQTGVLLRVIVMDVSRYQAGTWPLALVNPAITARRGGYESATEGCLSLPGIEAPVRRARQVRVTAQETDGVPVVLEATGLQARVLQHEIDHLNGLLFIDRVSRLERWRLRSALTKLSLRPVATPPVGVAPTVL